MRFIETLVERGGRGAREVSAAYFPVAYFDRRGRVDENRWLQELTLIERLLSACEQTEWTTFYGTQRDALFRWKPSASVLGQLQTMVRRAQPGA